jgi:Leucine-rich repeat (LRR) protein
MTATFSDDQDGICPTVVPCFCREDHSVSCSYQRLKELPDFLEFTNVWKELDLSENLILVLHRYEFVRVKVRSLILDSNMIRHIENGSFIGLSMLERLDLSHNELKYIPALIFEPLFKLRTLRIQYNDFNTLGELSMVGISQLYELDLTGNSFHTIPRASLCKISNLKKLILRHNHIQKLAPYAFVDLSLDYLDLGANKAPMVIDRDAFCGLDPQVVSSEPGVIDWTGLDTLRLDHNGLITLPPCLIQRMWTLSSLDISGNPIHCDCSLLLPKENGVKTDYPGAQCASPVEYAGRYTNDISLHNYHCLTQTYNDTQSCMTSMCISQKPDIKCTSVGSKNKTNYCYYSSMLCIFAFVIPRIIIGV